MRYSVNGDGERSMGPVDNSGRKKAMKPDPVLELLEGS